MLKKSPWIIMDLSEYEPSETKSKTTGVGSTVNMAEENKIASSTFTSDNGKLDISSKSIQLPLSVTTTTTGSVRKAEKYAETAMNMSILDPTRYGWTACGGISYVASRQHVSKPPPKLNLMVVVEFPLEPKPPQQKSSITTSPPAVFRDTIPWDLSDPHTPSPMVFATSISQEWGLDFDRTMDLAISIEQQIESHVTQYCQYAEPVTLKDPHGEDRDHLGPIIQPFRYDPVVDIGGKEGKIKPGYSRRYDSSRNYPHQPKTLLTISSGSSRSRDKSSDNNSHRPGSSKKKLAAAAAGAASARPKIGEVVPDVEPEYSNEVTKRLFEASMSDTQQRQGVTSGEGKFKLTKVRDIQCHICHKKRDTVYVFGCGIRKHMYCELHVKVRRNMDW
jgi:hypothetical protein